jgi:hypothetical protein
MALAHDIAARQKVPAIETKAGEAAARRGKRQAFIWSHERMALGR